MERDFPARKPPTTIVRTSEAVLVAQDYFKIGSVRVSYDDQVCEAAGCVTVPHDQPLEIRIRSEAARHGGDALLLSSENVPDSRVSYRAGRCLQQTSRTETYTASVPTCRINRAIIGGCETSYRSETRTRTVTQCVSYERIPVRTRTLTSAGLVFRRDPELLARDRAWRVALEHGSRIEVDLPTGCAAAGCHRFLNSDVCHGHGRVRL